MHSGGGGGEKGGSKRLTHGTQHARVLPVRAVVVTPIVLVDAAVHQVLLCAAATHLVQQNKSRAVACLGVGDGTRAKP